MYIHLVPKVSSYLLVLWYTLNIPNCRAQSFVNNGTLFSTEGAVVFVPEILINSPTATLTNNGRIVLKKDLVNDGIFTFSGKRGTVSFRGEGLQRISGDVPISLYNAILENTTPGISIALDGAMEVFGEFSFLEGILKVHPSLGLLSFEADARSSEAHNISHVEGWVAKKGDQNFIFPIGDQGYYAGAGIEVGSTDNRGFEAIYYHENSALTYPHEQKETAILFIDDREYWTLQKMNDSDETILSLFWSSDTSSPNVLNADKDNLQIVRWDTRLDKWVNEGGVVDPLQNKVTTPTVLSGYGVFALAIVASAEETVDLKIYNAISTDDDGKNDFFFIDGINAYPNNTVQVYNRDGIKVFETTDYDSHGNVFRGYSESSLTVNASNLLPSGTYYYVLTFEETTDTTKSVTRKKTGYLYLNTNQ